MEQNGEYNVNDSENHRHVKVEQLHRYSSYNDFAKRKDGDDDVHMYCETDWASPCRTVYLILPHKRHETNPYRDCDVNIENSPDN